MKINFVTPTMLSLIDITTMGDSSKRDDPTSIGQFDSGLKYAIALLLRHNVDIEISVYGGSETKINYSENFIDVHTFDKVTKYCESTNKEKELILVKTTRSPQGGSPQSQFDMREPSPEFSFTTQTGFATALGYNWELWMALRELWSNMLDEGGSIEEYGELDYGTCITLTFDEESEFGEIWKNRANYINTLNPIWVINDSIEVVGEQLAKHNHLRIYKQNILVYEDKDVPSRFAFNIKFGEIDERRILSNIYDVETTIANAILSTKSEKFLRFILTENFETEEKEFLRNIGSYTSVSDLAHDIATEVYNEFGTVQSYSFLMSAIKKRKDCKIGGKVIRSVEDSLWSYSNSVTVESKPKPLTVPKKIFIEVDKLNNKKVQDFIKKYEYTTDNIYLIIREGNPNNDGTTAKTINNITYRWNTQVTDIRNNTFMPEVVDKSLKTGVYKNRMSYDVFIDCMSYGGCDDEGDKEIKLPDSELQVEINRFYDFKLDVCVKKATLKGSKVVADKYEKCLIIDESFSVEKDMGEFIVQYIDLVKNERNVIKAMSNFILNLIKK